MEKPIEKKEIDSQNYSDTFGSSRHQLLQILDALDTGIFFLNSNLILDTTHSKFFSDIFEPENVSHRPFLELLENKVSEKTLEETQEYLNFIARDLGVDICLISTGAQRQETILI